MKSVILRQPNSRRTIHTYSPCIRISYQWKLVHSKFYQLYVKSVTFKYTESVLIMQVIGSSDKTFAVLATQLKPYYIKQLYQRLELSC
jgi:hypothetical protein